MLGCLIEKQRTTPEQYPLTRNSLRLACNQSTNRDPVVDFDEATVREAAEKLGRRGLARFASGQGSRAAKYRQVAQEKLDVGDAALALLAVLLLRGPQTPGELRGRSERMYRFNDGEELQAALDELVRADLAVLLERRPGQKEQRYAHLLAADAQEFDEPEAPAPAPAAAGPEPPAHEPSSAALEARVSALEDEVRRIRAELGL